MDRAESKIVRFEGFEANLATSELGKNRVRVRLGPKGGENMNVLRLSTIAVLLLSIAPSGCTSLPVTAAPESEHKSLMVFLVRHAEKADLSEDAELSAAGRERG